MNARVGAVVNKLGAKAESDRNHLRRNGVHRKRPDPTKMELHAIESITGSSKP